MSQFNVTLITPAGIINNAIVVGVEKIKRKRTIADDKDIFYYKSAIDGSVQFIGSEFELLKKWETSDKRTKKGTMIVKYFQNGAFIELLRHVILIDNISWDCYKSVATYDLKEVPDEMKQYEANKSSKYNVFDMVPSSKRITWDIVFSTGGASYPYFTQAAPFFTVNNSLLLKDVLQGLCQKTFASCMLKSGFFGWNEPQSYVIGDSPKLKYLILAHTSDIYRRSSSYLPASSPASVMELTLEECLQNICLMFNLKCDYNPLTNIFRLEHISWFDTTSSTENAMIEENKGKLSNYEYNSNDLCKSEKVTFENNVWSAELNSKDFIAPAIVYDAYDGNKDLRENSVSFVTDIHPTEFYNDPPGNQTQQKVDIEKVLIAALNWQVWTGSAYKNYLYWATASIYVNNSASLITSAPLGGTIPNYVLTWVSLATNYHRHGKSYGTGKLPQGTAATFGTKPRLVQRALKVIDNTLKKDLLKASITTGLGNGIVRQYERELASKYIICDVYHNAISSTSLPAPTALSDSYYTKTNISIDTYSQALNSLLVNDTSGCTVLSETKFTQAGGTVIINANGHFIYTPPVGYDGFDSFDYYIINGSNLVDTSSCVIAVRIPQVYVHKETITNVIGTNVNDQSKIQYYRTNAYDYPYNPNGMGLIIYMKGYNTLGGLVQTWNFSPSSENETIPPPTGFTVPTTFTKIIQTNSEYIIF